jgi:AbrB family looped-hinge helix DNA binding protein
MIHVILHRKGGALMLVSKVGKRRQVVIPKQVCEELGFREGDFVEIELRKREGVIVLKPKKLVDVDDLLTPEEEELVAKGFQQIEKGEYVTWEELKHELEA